MNTEQSPNWKKTLFIKSWAILVLIIIFVMLYFAVASAPLRSVMSIIKHGDIIYNFGMSTACVGAIPFMVYVFCLILRALFQKGTKVPEKPTFIGKFYLPISIITAFIFLFVSYLIPFWLMFSGYHPCHEKSLEYYYVIDAGLCKTIILPP